MNSNRKITLADIWKEKELKQKYRLKVSYKELDPEKQFKPDIKRIIEEQRKSNY